VNELTADQIDAMLGALRTVMEGAGPDDAVTTSELVDQLARTTGRAPSYLTRQVRAAIGQLRLAGRLEIVDVRRISPVDGRNTKIKAYRLVA
jgi:hypothetical protein